MTSSEATIALSNDFQIAETATYREKVESKTFMRFSDRIRENIYPRLRTNPYFGPNIKRLKGELSSIFRYRMGDYRLFYTIDSNKKLVFMLDIVHRRDAYRK
jgi:mRNA interferase RelE/StbE